MVYHSQSPYFKTSQRAITTAHLAQTMSLLELNNLELLEKITSEVSNNPALEIVVDYKCPTCGTINKNNRQCPKCTYNVQAVNEPIVFVSSREESHFSSSKISEFSTNEFSPQHEDLATYVLKQASVELDKTDLRIAVYILSNLDDDGFIKIAYEDISRYHHVSIEKIKTIFSIIKKCDPIGVGSNGPKEALLTQINLLSETKTIDPKLIEAIDFGYDLFSKQKNKELANLLGTSVTKVEKYIEFIGKNLNPFPGRAHWGSHRNSSNPTTGTYHKPDVIIHPTNKNSNTQLIVEILWPIQGSLRINPLFQKAIKDAPENKLEKWNADFEKANLLIKCLSQRNHTLVQLMNHLVNIQQEFILNGDAYLKPITRAMLAKLIGVHESTISRAVAGKTVQLPSRQIVPISKFFDRSLHIRAAVKKIIAKEGKPLSDTQISNLLLNMGHKIARRTVAKYRAMEGILPAHMRNQQ